MYFFLSLQVPSSNVLHTANTWTAVPGSFCINDEGDSNAETWDDLFPIAGGHRRTRSGYSQQLSHDPVYQRKLRALKELKVRRRSLPASRVLLKQIEAVSNTPCRRPGTCRDPCLPKRSQAVPWVTQSVPSKKRARELLRPRTLRTLLLR